MLAVNYLGYDMPAYMPSVLVSGGVLMAILGYLLAGTKGNAWWGCGLGCILGPIGILIAMLLPDQRNR